MADAGTGWRAGDMEKPRLAVLEWVSQGRWPAEAVVNSTYPPDYASLPEAGRLAIALRLARQVRVGLGYGGVSGQIRPAGAS